MQFNEEEIMNLDEILKQAPKDNLIGDSIIITYAKLQRYEKILCSVSGCEFPYKSRVIPT